MPMMSVHRIDCRRHLKCLRYANQCIVIYCERKRVFFFFRLALSVSLRFSPVRYRQSSCMNSPIPVVSATTAAKGRRCTATVWANISIFGRRRWTHWIAATASIKWIARMTWWFYVTFWIIGYWTLECVPFVIVSFRWIVIDAFLFRCSAILRRATANYFYILIVWNDNT